jgi:murein DD-endopeptidase MepM/ murein hydrolase activator NlpD
MTRGTKTLTAVVISFFAGVAADSYVRVYGPPQPARRLEAPEPREPLEPREPREPRLRLPIEGVDVETLKGGFAEARTGHPHEAVDILAPRNTPVHAVTAGTIAKLFISKAGGITVYQFDRRERYCFYYAHLQRYAPGLAEGDEIEQGQVIGYVGTSGNAPPDTPHLHFAVFELGPEKHWWEGTAIDPYALFKAQS